MRGGEQQRRTVAALQKAAREGLTMRIGVVTDDSPLTVAVGGNPSGPADVGTYVSPSALSVGSYGVSDLVAVLVKGRDMLVLGVINGAGGGGGGSPTGSAGGALDGSYPNPGIAASVAGNGLAETTDVLSVNVDGTTIEISSDSLRVKDGGLTDAKLATHTLSASLPDLGTWFSTAPANNPGTVTATANQSYYVWIVVPCKATLTGIAYTCIAAGSGNVRSSLYDSSGTRVANRTTNLACVGLTNQKVAFDSTYLAVPGVYFGSLTFSSGTSSFVGCQPAAPSGQAAGAGSGATIVSFTPPSAWSNGIPCLSTY